MRCRHCDSSAALPIIDLGSTPPSNSLLTKETLGRTERTYPLRVFVCENCWLVQTEDVLEAEKLFDSGYPYFSGYSKTWVEHCKNYAVSMADRFSLSSSATVVEVATNDGTLLQFFHEMGMNCVGIEPTSSTAEVARAKGLDIIVEFLTKEMAERVRDDGLLVDLLVANNVLAHVPAINDFSAACAELLHDHGLATFEFPHLYELVAGNQFDTIYHEHFSYLSLTTAKLILESASFEVFDVEKVPTHGGSLRVFAQRQNSGRHPRSARIDEILMEEEHAGLCSRDGYLSFQEKIERVKDDLLGFLNQAKRSGHSVVGFGAAAKGNTLLNFAGVTEDLLLFVADSNPAKQGKYLPGSRIPVVDESRMRELEPDYVLILPWNLWTELSDRLRYIKDWSGSFVRAVPELEIRSAS